MKQCPRCFRYHTGLCGIPPGVTLGYGARVSAVNPKIKAMPKSHLNTGSLQGLLNWVEKEIEAVIKMLKVVPPDMPEYSEFQNRLEFLEERLMVIRQQLAVQAGLK